VSEAAGEEHAVDGSGGCGSTPPSLASATTSSVHVAEYFGLYALQRQWRVQRVSLNTFSGLQDGLKWLCHAMRHAQ